MEPERLIGVICILTATASATDTNLVKKTQTNHQYKGGEIIVSAQHTQAVELTGTTRVLTADDLQRRGARNALDGKNRLPGTIP